MNLTDFCKQLTGLGIAFEEHAILAPFTTWKIGGPADVLVHLKSKEDIGPLLKSAKTFEIPVTYLGGGSNVLISDSGIRGLVIKNELTGITVDSEEQKIDNTEALHEIIATGDPAPRLIEMDTQEYYDFSKLDYDESADPAVKVKVASGTILAYANNYLIQNGITGLQWFAGIPGTIGGAVYNNIHGGSHFFSEFVESATVFDQNGTEIVLTKDQLGFDYDYSGLQQQTYFIAEVSLVLHKGDKLKAAKTSQAWAMMKKEKQPFNSAGCCFKNLSEQERLQLNLAGNSWGYIIDKVLNLKGKTSGGAQISEKHAAFIENKGQATAQDVMQLLNTIYDESGQKLNGITPKTEIFFLGFPREITAKFH